MDYLDMLKDLADGSGDVKPQEARSILNGAREKLDELESRVEGRLPDGNDTPDVDRRRKAKSEYSRQERAEQYQEWRDEGKDPNEEWEKLPE
jgi:hypothetical protein